MKRQPQRTCPEPFIQVVLFLLLSIILATTTLPALAGLTRVKDPEPSEPPRWVAWGSMADNQPFAPGHRGIYDWELAQMIADSIGTSADMLIVNTACYGGDFLENFNNNPNDDRGGEDWFTFDNTTIISGNPPARTTEYGGFHRGAAQNMIPGATTSDILRSPSSPREVPQQEGSDKRIGGNNSTHVLVWAGNPNALDRQDIDDIRSNFNSAQHPDATVTVLAAHDAAGTTGNVTTGPATPDALKHALVDIAALMGPGEQFILFVTDHGDFHMAADLATVAPPAGTAAIEVPLDTSVLTDMRIDAGNVPSFTLGSAAPFPNPELITVTLQSQNPWSVSLSDPSVLVGTLTSPAGTQIVTYTIPLFDENFAFNQQSQVSPQMFYIQNDTSSSLALAYAELGSGAIARAIPETTSGTLMMLGVLVTWAVFRAPRAPLLAPPA